MVRKEIHAEQPEWLTVEEYAHHWRISLRTARRWIASDPNVRVRKIGPTGRIVRIHRSELNREQNLPDAA